jgi:hypothetical protein
MADELLACHRRHSELAASWRERLAERGREPASDRPRLAAAAAAGARRSSGGGGYSDREA